MTKDKAKKTNNTGLDYKRLPVEVKVNKKEGIIEAYVSTFGNKDLAGEIIDKGAFTESLQRKLPKGVWSHDWDKPVAKTLEGREDEKGLYIKGQFNLDTQRGREAFSDIAFDIIDEFSIGFRVAEEEFDEDGTRHLKKIDLYEWSPVLVGANPATELIGVKSDQLKKELEKDDSEKVLLLSFLQGLKELKNLIDKLDNVIDPLNELLSAFDSSKIGEKVESTPDDKEKIVRIRQTAKKADRLIEKVLKISK